MTLKEANALNFSILTVFDIQTIYRRFGYSPVLKSGRIKGFINNYNEGI